MILTSYFVLLQIIVTMRTIYYSFEPCSPQTKIEMSLYVINVALRDNLIFDYAEN